MDRIFELVISGAVTATIDGARLIVAVNGGAFTRYDSRAFPSGNALDTCAAPIAFERVQGN